MKFGVRQLLMLTAFAALAVMLLLYADEDGVTGAVTATLVYLALLVGALAWACGHGKRRARGAGLLLGCLSYLLICGYVVPNNNVLGQHIPTRWILEAIHPVFQRREVTNPAYQVYLNNGVKLQDLTTAGIGPTMAVPEPGDFVHIGEMLIALLIGLAASWVAPKMISPPPDPTASSPS